MHKRLFGLLASAALAFAACQGAASPTPSTASAPASQPASASASAGSPAASGEPDSTTTNYAPEAAAKTGGTSTSLGDLQTPATGSPFRTFFTPVASSTFATSGGNGYRRPAPETFGSRNSLYGPRYANVDFSVAKRFAITERVNTQFRLEVFNLFNHPQLSTPNGCIDCTGDAGQIKSLQSNIGQMRNLQFGLRVDF